MKIEFSNFKSEIIADSDEYLRKLENMFEENAKNLSFEKVGKVEKAKEEISICNKKIFNNVRSICECESEDVLNCEVFYLLGNCICKYQKEQEVIFHASGVKYKEYACLFSGVSGSGKTTMSLDFAKYGEWMGDEYCHMDFIEGTAWFENSPLHLKRENPYLNKFENVYKLPTYDRNTGRKGFYIGRQEIEKLNLKRTELFEQIQIKTIVFPCYNENWRKTEIFKVESEEYPGLILSGIIGKQPQSLNLKFFLEMCAGYKIRLLKVVFSDGQDAAMCLKEYLDGNILI